MASSSILTGQFVRIRQTSASVGERMLAQLIDWAIQGAWFFGTMYVYISYIESMLKFSEDLKIILLFVVIILPTLFYALICGLFANGQTIGKHLLKLRVVRTDGSMPGIGSYLLRWLFMLIDGPVMYGLGVLVMVLNKDNRRLGDLAAGTMVIKTGIYRRLQVSLEEFAPFSRNYRPAYPAAENLSLEQVNLISQTLSLKDNDQCIHALAEQVKRTLGISQVHESDDTTFLWHVRRDYQYYALEEI